MTAPTISATPKKALDQRATSRHDNAVTIEMGEPGAAGRPLPQNAGRRGSHDDRVGEPPLSHEIPPGRRMRPNSLSLGPAFGDWPVRVISASCPVDWWEARDNPANSRRRLRTWPKLRPGSSHCTSPKTSPLASLVGSHHPRPVWLTIRISAFASPVLQAESRVLLPIQFPRRRVRSSTSHVLADRTAVDSA